MKKPYRLGPRTRRVLRAVVETMKPRWEDYEPPIEDGAIVRIERDLSRFPRRARIAVIAVLWVVQWGGLLVGELPVPFTRLGPERRKRRLDRMRHSSGVGYLLFKALKTLVQMVCYGMPEVERYLGIDRAHWREDRNRLRARLLAADARRIELPQPPAPLGSAGVVAPEDFLVPGEPHPKPGVAAVPAGAREHHGTQDLSLL